MAPYTIASDNILLSCTDVGELNVYEIENLDTVPVEMKQLGSFQIGRGKTYDALKIGDKEIKAHDLRRVMEDLRYSRLIVNREGLCFLSTEGITSKFFDVMYYRMFDRFDWFKYGVKMNLNTKWIQSDIIAQIYLEEEDESEDDDDSVEEEKLEDAEKGLEQLAQELLDKENELSLRVFEYSGGLNARDFLMNLVYRVRIPFPSNQITQRRTNRYFSWETTEIAGIYTVMDFKMTKELVSSLAITVCLANSLYDGGWYAVKVSNALLDYKFGLQPPAEALTGTLVYYGGGGTPARIVRSSASFPQDRWDVLLPFNPPSTCEFPNGGVYYLQGCGAVVGYFFGDP